MASSNHAASDAGDALDPLLRGEVAFRLLVDAVQDYAIFLLSTEGRVLTWNLGAERIEGYAAHEIIGRHFSVFYTPDEREAGRPMMLLGLAAEQGRFEDEGWRVRKDGTWFWADVIVTALRDESGAPYAYAKVTRDVTERKASEERQTQLLAEQRARAAAEEALVARDRFLSIASHELKTPVASLRLSAEALQHAKAAGRLNELLDISRLRAGVLPTHFAPTDLVELAREVIARFADAGIDGRVRLEAPSPVIATVDASRIDQVLTNLLDNALKYSDSPANVHVSVRELADAVELTVSDRGIGLDDGASRTIFDAFGRGEAVEHVQGLGLGLHITQQIVERHRGTITAEPRDDGPGASFTVRLPRMAAVAAE